MRISLISLLLLLIPSLGFTAVPANEVGPTTSKTRHRDRFTLSTNLLDWALVIPNIGVEYDLGNPQRMSTPSIFMQFKGSPAGRDYLKEGLYNQDSYRFWDARLDWRYHFTFHRHAELFTSRFYAGLFGEYMDYTMRTPLDMRHRDALKDGTALIFGLTGGYDFPGFSYHNKHFFQFQVGTSAGVIHTEYDAHTAEGIGSYGSTFPMLTELRFALTYRTRSISRKYWQPNYARYQRIKAEDDRLLEQLDALQAEMEIDPVTIYMKHAPGIDTLFLEPLTLPQVRRAFRIRFGSPYFRPEQLQPLHNNVAFPITAPGEHYLVRYSIPVRAHDYDAEESEREYYFPFRVRFEGYDEAYNRMLSYNRALRNYYQSNGKRLPSMMVQALNRDEFVGSPTISEILKVINAKWPESDLSRSEVTGVYYREDGEFKPIKEDEMTRRGTYAFGLRFHSQISESFDTLTTRFNLEPFVEDEVQSMYETLLRASTTTEFYVPHTWLNGKEREVTRLDVIKALEAEGYKGYTEDNIQVDDTIRYGRNVGIASFGNVLPELRFIYVVEDSTSLALGNQLHKALQKGLNPRKATWNLDIKFNSTYGPICQGKWNSKHELVPADPTEVIDAVMRFLRRANPNLVENSIMPFMVENYTYSGVHEIPDGKPLNRWTILRFAYRFINTDGRSRVAYAHVAYRLKLPSRSHD